MKEGLFLSCLQLLCNLGIDALSELFHAHGSLFATTLLTHRYQALGTLLLTNDNHVRNTLQLVVANLAANLLVTVFIQGTNSLVVELLTYLLSIVVELLRDRENCYLVWSQPQWEVTGCMLDENGCETLQ